MQQPETRRRVSRERGVRQSRSPSVMSRYSLVHDLCSRPPPIVFILVHEVHHLALASASHVVQQCSSHSELEPSLGALPVREVWQHSPMHLQPGRGENVSLFYVKANYNAKHEALQVCRAPEGKTQ